MVELKTIEREAEFFKALGHPTRLLIVKELLSGTKCVGEIEHTLGVSQANASQHLGVLRTCGIVDCLKDGNTRCYYLKDPGLTGKIIKTVEKGTQ